MKKSNKSSWREGKDWVRNRFLQGSDELAARWYSQTKNEGLRRARCVRMTSNVLEVKNTTQKKSEKRSGLAI